MTLWFEGSLFVVPYLQALDGLQKRGPRGGRGGQFI